jgi:hypothetical protein
MASTFFTTHLASLRKVGTGSRASRCLVFVLNLPEIRTTSASFPASSEIAIDPCRGKRRALARSTLGYF